MTNHLITFAHAVTGRQTAILVRPGAYKPGEAHTAASDALAVAMHVLQARRPADVRLIA